MARSSVDDTPMFDHKVLLHVFALTALIGSATVLAQAPKPTRPASAPVPGSPTAGVVVSSDFVVGAEDVLGVMFWREADLSGDVVVRSDGRITLPLIGDIAAAGQTPAALREQIQAAATKYLTDPNVTVMVKQINSRKVFITGQIGQPGSYPLTGPRTVMQLISLAGGLTQYAKSDAISILRQEQGRTRAMNFNYRDVAMGKNVQQNIQLQPGDTIVVPE
jgi:polysaccharide export outer membrane protein